MTNAPEPARANADSGSSRSGEDRNPPRWLLRALAKTHVRLNSLSGGRIGNKVKGHEVCFVTMTGAVSLRTLAKPLMYVPHGDGVLLVASLGGGPKNPTWYGNLVKHPDIEVRHRRRTMHLRARLATDEERPSLWPICDEHFPPYAEYRSKASREIPIFVCEPRVPMQS